MDLVRFGFGFWKESHAWNLRGGTSAAITKAERISKASGAAATVVGASAVTNTLHVADVGLCYMLRYDPESPNPVDPTPNPVPQKNTPAENAEGFFSRITCYATTPNPASVTVSDCDISRSILRDHLPNLLRSHREGVE